MSADSSSPKLEDGSRVAVRGAGPAGTFFSYFKRCMPPTWKPEIHVCHCMPRIQISGAIQPFADRMVFVGDTGVCRLYKDGIGSAYRTTKAAAATRPCNQAAQVNYLAVSSSFLRYLQQSLMTGLAGYDRYPDTRQVHKSGNRDTL